MVRVGAALALFLTTIVGQAVPALAQKPALAMLGTLDRGKWELRYRDGSGKDQICYADAEDFVQLRHKRQSCRRVVVEDSPNEVTVQYTCPGQGYGRTTIRQETRSLVQVDSQGIADGLPFSFAAEARRIGDCSG